MDDIPTTPITGKALLQKAKELSRMPRKEIARRCGYVTVTNSGRARINLTDFYDALLAARGLDLNPETSKDGRGREPTYLVSVHRNGQIVIGSTYTEEMHLKQGDEFLIKLGYKHIHLVQVDKNKTDETDTDFDDEDVDSDY
ncbi:MAG: AbrB family transcriptional regulator [Synechococcales cyanobacterium]